MGTYQYQLYIKLRYKDGSSTSDFYISGVSSFGSVSTFELQIDPTPGSPVFITRVTTFDSTFEDIENCHELDLIDNQGITNSLSRKIENAAKQASEGKVETARNILNAFINEVQVQTSKHISEEAVQILIEDAEYLINHQK